MDFFHDEDWHGSYFELAIEYKNKLSSDILAACVQALWSDEHLLGPWEIKEDIKKVAVKPILEPSENLFSNYQYGIIQFEKRTIGCLSLTVREKGGSDWLDLCIPSGMLEMEFTIQYPLVPLNNEFLTRIELIFLTIAQKVYEVNPFDLALIGEEVSGINYADSLTPDDIVIGGVILPKDTAKRLGVSHLGLSIDKNLVHYPNKINSFGV